MNSKEEKYYNYIADDLNKKVEIIHKHYEMAFPWEEVWWSTDANTGEKFPMGSIDIKFFGLSYYEPSSSHMKKFAKYVEENYGVREEEVEPIYKLFRNKLLPRIGYPGSVKD